MPRRGFSLVELLITIGIIGLLVGLLIPALAGSRRRAMETRTLAHLRQIGISLELYVNGSRDTYPFHPPGLPFVFGTPESPGGIIYSSDSPWSLAWGWPTLFHQFAPWPEHFRLWAGGEPSDGANEWTDAEGRARNPVYHLSNSFIASPQAWMNQGEARVRPVRSHEVRFNSAKVTLFDRHRPYLRGEERLSDRRGVLAADGSGHTAHDTDAAPPVPNRLREPGLTPARYHDTPSGVQGRDL